MKETLDNLSWIEEHLPHDIQMIPKHGGNAYFLDTHFVLLLVERTGHDAVYEHKGVTYPFNLWNGCIFPVQYKRQSAFFIKYVFLENHPVNKDWLYIPAESENFEEEVKQMLRELSRRNPLLGLAVKMPKPKKPKDQAVVVRHQVPKKVKADKKRENSFILSMVGGKTSKKS